MDRRETSRKSGNTVHPTVVLLLSLAAFAEAVGVRSWPVRCLVMAILRRAESAARTFALDLAADYGCLLVLPALPASQCATGSGEAEHLSRCFRALAHVIGELLQFASGPVAGSLPVARGICRFQGLAHGIAAAFNAFRISGGIFVLAYDTS